MADEYNRDLCDERHETVKIMFTKIDENMKVLFNRLNWFYVVAIGTLAAAIASFFKA